MGLSRGRPTGHVAEPDLPCSVLELWAFALVGSSGVFAHCWLTTVCQAGGLWRVRRQRLVRCRCAAGSASLLAYAARLLRGAEQPAAWGMSKMMALLDRGWPTEGRRMARVCRMGRPTTSVVGAGRGPGPNWSWSDGTAKGLRCTCSTVVGHAGLMVLVVLAWKVAGHFVRSPH